MKKLSVIFTIPIMYALTLVFIINAPAQYTTPKISMDKPDQSWQSMPGLKLAYHDLQTEPEPWADLDIYEIYNFVDESIKKGTLIGHGSNSLSDDRLNILKDKIDAASNALENGTFEETCGHLLDAYQSTDGLPQPPDLVYGKAAPELADMIEYMIIEIIGCD
jgi:hypothetical protein